MGRALARRTNEYAWGFYEWDPGERGSVRVGDPGTPSATLAPGSYWLDLLCMEDRTFGGVRLTRASESGRPFSVVR